MTNQFASQTSDPVTHAATAARVTAHLSLWQGLRLVPRGLFVGTLAWTQLHPSWEPGGLPGWAVTMALLALLAAGTIVVDKHYDRTFGQVIPLAAAKRRRARAQWLIALPVAVAAALIDTALRWPVAVSAVTWAVTVVAYWAGSGRGRYHWLTLAGLVAACGALPALQVVAPGAPAAWLVLATVGTGTAVCGALDHLALSRALPATSS